MLNTLKDWLKIPPVVPVPTGPLGPLGPHVPSNVNLRARQSIVVQAQTQVQAQTTGGGGGGGSVVNTITGGAGPTSLGPSSSAGQQAFPNTQGSPPRLFDGAMIVMNMNGKPRFMNYTQYWVLVHDGTIHVVGKADASTVAMIPLSATYGVYKSTSELIKSWVINSESEECPPCMPSIGPEPSTK